MESIKKVIFWLATGGIIYFLSPLERCGKIYCHNSTVKELEMYVMRKMCSMLGFMNLQ